MLQIFKHLDVESLETSMNVCQRWNYLINTNELWIYKCKTLGKSERLYEVEKVIYDDLEEDEDIDWRQAYCELVEFVNRIKSDQYKTMINDFDKNALEESTIFTSSIIPGVRRPSIVSTGVSELSRRQSLVWVSGGLDSIKRRSTLGKKKQKVEYKKINFI